MSWNVVVDLGVLRELRAWPTDRQLIYQRIQRRFRSDGPTAFSGLVALGPYFVAVIYESHWQFRMTIQIAANETMIVRHIEVFEVQEWPHG